MPSGALTLQQHNAMVGCPEQQKENFPDQTFFPIRLEDKDQTETGISRDAGPTALRSSFHRESEKQIENDENMLTAESTLQSTPPPASYLRGISRR